MRKQLQLQTGRSRRSLHDPTLTRPTKPSNQNHDAGAPQESSHYSAPLALPDAAQILSRDNFIMNLLPALSPEVTSNNSSLACGKEATQSSLPTEYGQGSKLAVSLASMSFAKTENYHFAPANETCARCAR